MLIEIDDSYVRSFLGKGHSDRAADSTVSSGDERYLIFKLSQTVSSAILYAQAGAASRTQAPVGDSAVAWDETIVLFARTLLLLLPKCRLEQNACRHRCDVMFQTLTPTRG